MNTEELLLAAIASAVGGAGDLLPAGGALVWYDFASVAGPTGTPVPTILDRSGNGFHGIDATGHPDVLVQAGFLNGRNVVANVTVDAWFNFTTGQVPVGAVPFDLFAVCRRSGVDFSFDNVITRSRPSTVGAAGNLALAVAGGSGLTTGRIEYTTTGAIVPLSSVTVAKDVWAIHELDRDASHVHRYFINGTNTSAGADAARTNTGNFGSGAFLAGSTGAIYTNGWRGYVAEFILYARLLSAADKLKTYTYLQQKWGL